MKCWIFQIKAINRKARIKLHKNITLERYLLSLILNALKAMKINKVAISIIETVITILPPGACIFFRYNPIIRKKMAMIRFRSNLLK